MHANILQKIDILSMKPQLTLALFAAKRCFIQNFLVPFIINSFIYQYFFLTLPGFKFKFLILPLPISTICYSKRPIKFQIIL